jgi:hypothetical protein
MFGIVDEREESWKGGLHVMYAGSEVEQCMSKRE